MRDHSSLDTGTTSNTSQSGGHIDLFLKFDGELDKSLNGLDDGNSTDATLRLRGGDNDRSSVDGVGSTGGVCKAGITSRHHSNSFTRGPRPLANQRGSTIIIAVVFIAGIGQVIETSIVPVDITSGTRSKVQVDKTVLLREGKGNINSIGIQASDR